MMLVWFKQYSMLMSMNTADAQFTAPNLLTLHFMHLLMDKHSIKACQYLHISDFKKGSKFSQVKL